MDDLQELIDKVIAADTEDLGELCRIAHLDIRTDLKGADLRGCDLTGVDLRGADLRGADIRGARLDEGALDEAILDGQDD